MMTTPYNGTENWDDKLVQPWYIPGWTAQAIQQDTVSAPASSSGLPSPPPLPSNLVYAELTSAYLDIDGNPLSGFLTFQMSESITVTSGGTSYRMPQRFTGWDNTSYPGAINNAGTGRIYIRRGVLSVILMTTQNPAIVTDSGNPLTYHVVEHYLGGQQYDISVPEDETSPVDLRSLIVAGSVQPFAYDPAFPLGIESYLPIGTY